MQISHWVEKESILKVSLSVEDTSGVSAECGGFGRSSGVMRHIGRSAWVQHFPWFTQPLQNPQSPSLHWLHFQKQSLAVDWQMSQKSPACNLRAGSSLVICLSSFVTRAVSDGRWYLNEKRICGVTCAGVDPLVEEASILSKFASAEGANPAHCKQPRPKR